GRPTALVAIAAAAVTTRGAAVPEDAQVVGRARVQVRDGGGGIAVPRPEYSVGSHQHPIGSSPVRGGRTAAARQRPGHAFDAVHEQIVLCVEDIDTEVGSVGNVNPLSSRIHPADICADDRVVRHRDYTDETE